MEPSNLSLFLILAMVSMSMGQRFVPGYCPSPAPQEDFDKQKFFGHWVEAEKTPSMFDMVMRCMELDYSDDNDGSINVIVKGVSLAGLPVTVNGDGLVQDVTKHGHYSVRYGFGVPFQGTLTTILDTDYEEYAVVYSCTNSLLSGMFHSEYIWILSKDGYLSNPTRQNIYERLDRVKINRSGLQLSDRNGCPTNGTTQRETELEQAVATVTKPVVSSGEQPISLTPVSSVTGSAPSAAAIPMFDIVAATSGPMVNSPVKEAIAPALITTVVAEQTATPVKQVVTSSVTEQHVPAAVPLALPVSQ